MEPSLHTLSPAAPARTGAHTSIHRVPSPSREWSKSPARRAADGRLQRVHRPRLGTQAATRVRLADLPGPMRESWAAILCRCCSSSATTWIRVGRRGLRATGFIDYEGPIGEQALSVERCRGNWAVGGRSGAKSPRRGTSARRRDRARVPVCLPNLSVLTRRPHRSWAQNKLLFSQGRRRKFDCNVNSLNSAASQPLTLTRQSSHATRHTDASGKRRKYLLARCRSDGHDSMIEFGAWAMAPSRRRRQSPSEMETDPMPNRWKCSV